MQTDSVTREEDLVRALNMLGRELPQAQWIALVDQNGLMMGCVPARPDVDPDGIAGITAAAVMAAERVLDEVRGGQLRYVNVAGSMRQHLMIMIRRDRFLSIGLPPNALVQETFRPILKSVPGLLAILEKRYPGSQ